MNRLLFLKEDELYWASAKIYDTRMRTCTKLNINSYKGTIGRLFVYVVVLVGVHRGQFGAEPEWYRVVNNE